MSWKELAMRLLPVIAFTVIVLIVAIKPPEPSWGIPLLGVAVLLAVLSIKVWVPKHHHGQASRL